MDDVSWPKSSKMMLATTLGCGLRALCLACLLTFAASCTNRITTQENVDFRDGSDDIVAEETVENTVDIVTSDSQTALEICNPQNVLPLTCESLDAWWWEGEENPRWTFDLGVPEGPCELDMEVSHEWLSAIFSSDTGTLTVEVF